MDHATKERLTRDVCVTAAVEHGARWLSRSGSAEVTYLLHARGNLPRAWPRVMMMIRGKQMKSRAKPTRSGRRPSLDAKPSGVFIVPSHGRLARRGSTEIVEEDTAPRDSWKGASSISR